MISMDISDEEKISNHKLNQIIDIWYEHRECNADPYEVFASFIGYPRSRESGRRWIVDVNNPEVRRIIDIIYEHPDIIPALTGPHGDTIFKVLLLQNGDKNGDSD